MPMSQNQTSRAEISNFQFPISNERSIPMGAPNGLEIYFMPTPIPERTMINDARAGKSQEIFGDKLYLSSKNPPIISTAPPSSTPRKNFKGTMLKSGLAIRMYAVMVMRNAPNTASPPKSGIGLEWILRGAAEGWSRTLNLKANRFTKGVSSNDSPSASKKKSM